jgi:HD-GYP domain-containing protein (c-di-GMP phosphodiesterase class II)
MLDIASIIQKHRAQSAHHNATASAPAPAPVTPQSPLLASLLQKGFLQNHDVDIQAVYAGLVDAVAPVYVPQAPVTAEILKNVRRAVAPGAELALRKPQDIVRACLQEYPRQDATLHFHGVNVALLSMILGARKGLNKEELIPLGSAALVHDVGLLNHLEIINKEGTLSKEERLRVNGHPSEGAHMLSGAGLSTRENSIVLQHHERLDGTGYPSGLTAETIDEWAVIVALADVYEAMTHRRSYRERYSPLETTKYILSAKTAYDQKLLKAMLTTVGIFPLGTAVQLNTKEVAIVVDQNPDSPLCPLVCVVLDAQGKELPEPKQLNLAEHRGLIYVEDCVKT